MYTDPPENAVVVCVDEKSVDPGVRARAADAAAAPGLPARGAHDYKRNGTTTLFASLEVATGKVVHTCMPRTASKSSSSFQGKWPRPTRDARAHIICDNYSAHKAPDVTKWLEKNKRVALRFTPTGASWMSLVESFFSVISRQAIRRGAFASVDDLVGAIEVFISGWNGRCEPFRWTKTADEILCRAKMVKKLQRLATRISPPSPLLAYHLRYWYRARLYQANLPSAEA